MKNRHNIPSIFLNDKFIQNTCSYWKILNISLKMGSINFILPAYLGQYKNERVLQEAFAMSFPHIPIEKLLQVRKDRIKDIVCLLCYL